MTATMNGIVVTFDTSDPWPTDSWPNGVFCTIAPKADSEDGYDDVKDLHSMYIIEGPPTSGDFYTFESDFVIKANGECNGEPAYVAMDTPTAAIGVASCEDTDPEEFGHLVTITDEKECADAAKAAGQAFKTTDQEFFKNLTEPLYIKRFDGECEGAESIVYEGCHYAQEQRSLEYDDNPGSNPEENIRECAKACYARAAKAFEVIPSTGRCWCTDTDADTCTIIARSRHDGTCTTPDNGSGYERFDIVDGPRPLGCHTTTSQAGVGTYFFNPLVDERRDGKRVDWTNRLVCKSCNDPKDHENYVVPISAPNEYFQFGIPDAVNGFEKPAVRFTHFVTDDDGHCSFAILVDDVPVYEFDYAEGEDDSSGTMTTTVNLPDNAKNGTFTVSFESGGKRWAGKGGQRAIERPHTRQARHEVWGGTMSQWGQGVYGHVNHECNYAFASTFEFMDTGRTARSETATAAAPPPTQLPDVDFVPPELIASTEEMSSNPEVTAQVLNGVLANIAAGSIDGATAVEISDAATVLLDVASALLSSAHRSANPGNLEDQEQQQLQGAGARTNQETAQAQVDNTVLLEQALLLYANELSPDDDVIVVDDGPASNVSFVLSSVRVDEQFTLDAAVLVEQGYTQLQGFNVVLPPFAKIKQGSSNGSSSIPLDDSNVDGTDSVGLAIIVYASQEVFSAATDVHKISQQGVSVKYGTDSTTGLKFDEGSFVTLEFPITGVLNGNAGVLQEAPCGFYVPSNAADAVPEYADFLGKWRTDGCEARNITANSVICECNHLTHFAVLFQTGDIDCLGKHAKVLTALTSVGCIVGSIALLLTLVCFIMFRSEVELGEKIVAHLSAALLLAMLTFAAGSNPSAHKGSNGCAATAGVLHYLFLSVWTWQAAEAWHLTELLVTVFNPKRGVRLFALVGWGVPLLFVVPALAVWPDAYGTDNVCWIEPTSPAIWFFVAPALICLLICVGSMVRIMRSVTETTKSLKTQVKAFATFGSVLGLTQVFGGLSSIPPSCAAGGVDSRHATFGYLFAIGLSIQGILILYFHLIRKDKFKDAWKTFSFTSRDASSSGGLNLSGGRGGKVGTAGRVGTAEKARGISSYTTGANDAVELGNAGGNSALSVEEPPLPDADTAGSTSTMNSETSFAIDAGGGLRMASVRRENPLSLVGNGSAP